MESRLEPLPDDPRKLKALLLDQHQKLAAQDDALARSGHEIEILKALRGELDMEIAAEQEVAGPSVEDARIKSDAEHQLWPFEGEYWRDELGFYRQPIASQCGR